MGTIGVANPGSHQESLEELPAGLVTDRRVAEIPEFLIDPDRGLGP